MGSWIKSSKKVSLVVGWKFVSGSTYSSPIVHSRPPKWTLFKSICRYQFSLKTVQFDLKSAQFDRKMVTDGCRHRHKQIGEVSFQNSKVTAFPLVAMTIISSPSKQCTHFWREYYIRFRNGHQFHADIFQFIYSSAQIGDQNVAKLRNRVLQIFTE